MSTANFFIALAKRRAVFSRNLSKNKEKDLRRVDMVKNSMQLMDNFIKKIKLKPKRSPNREDLKKLKKHRRKNSPENGADKKIADLAGCEALSNKIYRRMPAVCKYIRQKEIASNDKKSVKNNQTLISHFRKNTLIRELLNKPFMPSANISLPIVEQISPQNARLCIRNTRNQQISIEPQEKIRNTYETSVLPDIAQSVKNSFITESRRLGRKNRMAFDSLDLRNIRFNSISEDIKINDNNNNF